MVEAGLTPEKAADPEDNPESVWTRVPPEVQVEVDEEYSLAV